MARAHELLVTLSPVSVIIGARKSWIDLPPESPIDILADI